MKSVSYGCVVAAVACVFGTPLQAQESTSAALAKELVAALDSSKIDTIAAKDPASPGTYVAALYIPGVELLVVAAKYAVPAVLDARLAKKEYKEIYGDLSGASVAGTKVFVEDLGANGLSARRSENQPFDSFESSGKRTAFDGDWDKQKLSREDYQRIFSAAEARYTQMLTVLIAQIKKGR